VRRRTLALVLALSLAAAACGGDDDATPTPTTTSEATTTTAEDATTTTSAPGSGVTVTLLDPGAEPRVALRYRVVEGATDAVTQRNEVTIAQEVGGQRQELAVPATEIDIDYAAEDVGDGRFTAVGTFGAARASGGDPAAAAETQRLLQLLEGASIATVTTDRGQIVETAIEGLDETGNPVFDELASSLADQAASLAFPFPEEPVGVGARWSISTEVEIAGLPLRAEYLVTATRVDEDGADADVEATLTFVAGPVELQGTRAEVIDGQLAGTGTVSWALAGRLVPRLQLEMSGSATLEAGGTRLVQEQSQRTAVVDRG